MQLNPPPRFHLPNFTHADSARYFVQNMVCGLSLVRLVVHSDGSSLLRVIPINIGLDLETVKMLPNSMVGLIFNFECSFIPKS